MKASQYLNQNFSDLQNTVPNFLEMSGTEENVSITIFKLCGNYQQYKLRSQSNLVSIVLKLVNNVTKTTGFRLNFKGVLTIYLFIYLFNFAR
jgi:light-regulated signal transduction histidine kinase (bacteriophytochrome)